VESVSNGTAHTSTHSCEASTTYQSRCFRRAGAAAPLPPPTGVLHTIVFNRCLGQVRPVDVDSELFDITYVRAPLCPQPVVHQYQ
jgi:Autophagy-related protein 101